MARTSFGHKVMVGLGVMLLSVIVLAVLLCVVSFFRFQGREATITRNFAAELNEAYTKPDANDPAWPHYLRAYAMIYPEPPAIQDMRNHPARDEAVARFREWLKANPGFREAALAAAAREEIGFRLQSHSDPAFLAIHGEPPNTAPPDHNPLLFAVPLDHARAIRPVARVLEFHAGIAAADGEFDAFVENMTAMVVMSEHANKPPTHLNQLIRFSILGNMGLRIIRTVHAHGASMPSRTLDALDTLLASIKSETLLYDHRVERMLFDDFMQRMFTDDGQGDGQLTADGLTIAMLNQDWSITDPIVAVFMTTRADTVAAYDRITNPAMARAAKPIYQWQPDDQASTTATGNNTGNIVADSLFDHVLPVFSATLLVPDRVIMSIEGARTVIALERHRRAHGRYPGTLAELLPEFLDALPIDRATGEPLVYRLTDAGPLLYSVGLNYTDNGGTRDHRAWRRWMPREELERRLQSGEDPSRLPAGDLVLYPPEPATR